MKLKPKAKRTRSTPPTNQIRHQTEPYHQPQQYQTPYQEQSFQEEQFSNSPYRAASRYPDVVSHSNHSGYNESSPAVRLALFHKFKITK